MNPNHHLRPHLISNSFVTFLYFATLCNGIVLGDYGSNTKPATLLRPRPRSRSRPPHPNSRFGFRNMSAGRTGQNMFHNATMFAVVEKCDKNAYEKNYLCPSGWVPLKSRCYRNFNGDRSQSESYDYCKTHRSTLAAFFDKTTWEGFIQHFKYRLTRNEGYWMSMNNFGLNRYYWNYQSVRKREVPSYKRVQQNPEGYGGENLDCVFLVNTGSKDMKWYNSPCDREKRVICTADGDRKFFPLKWLLTLSPPQTTPPVFGEALELQCIGSYLKGDSVELVITGKQLKARFSTTQDSGETTPKLLRERRTEHEYIKDGGKCIRRTIFTVTVVVVAELKGAAIECVGVNYKTEDLRKDVHSNKVVIENIRYIARKPTSTVSPEDGKLTLGKTATVECVSKIGDGKVATVAVFTYGECGNWSFNVDMKERVTQKSYVPEECVTVSVTATKRDLAHYGNVIQTNLTFPARVYLDGAHCVCFSYDASSRVAQGDFINDTDELQTTSRPLTFVYPPWDPRLSVQYHAAPSTVYGGVPLTASCTSQLGSDGLMAWVLNTTEGEPLRWEVPTSGKMTSPSHGVTIAKVWESVVKCEFGWTVSFMSKSCLKLSESREVQTWKGARDKCRSEGGDLVAIRRRETNRLVNEMLPNEDGFWIGLNDIRKDGVFVWLDERKKASYTMMSKSPDDEHCAYTHNGEWNDEDCSYKLRYFCEKPALKSDVDGQSEVKAFRSLISLQVNSSIDGTTLVCEISRNGSGMSFLASSDPLEFEYEITEPESWLAKVGDSSLRLRCSAHVGVDGVLSFVVFSGGRVQYLNVIDLTANVTEVKPSPRLTFESIEVVLGHERGPFIKAQALYQISGDPTHVRFSCFSFEFPENGTAPPGLPNPFALGDAASRYFWPPLVVLFLLMGAATAFLTMMTNGLARTGEGGDLTKDPSRSVNHTHITKDVNETEQETADVRSASEEKKTKSSTSSDKQGAMVAQSSKSVHREGVVDAQSSKSVYHVTSEPTVNNLG